MNDYERYGHESWYSKYKKILENLNTFKPKTKKEFEFCCEVKLNHIGSGAYRNSYKLANLPFVIKFPINPRVSNINHTRAEIKTIKRIRSLRKYEKLREFLPNMAYADARNGIIMLEYYKPYRYNKHNTKCVMAHLVESIVSLVWAEGKSIYGTNIDVHGSNIGMDEDGYPKLIDLGYFLPLGKD